MGYLILIRHGETEWNCAGKYQGQKDIPLTNKGVSQAKELADSLSFLPINAVLTSDLNRAKHTGEIIAKMHNLEVEVDQRLREYNFGVWEGLTRAEVIRKYPDIFRQRQIDSNTRIPDGETGSEMEKRISFWLDDLCDNYSGTVVAVSHGGTIRALLSKVLAVPANKMYSLRLDNCGLSMISWKQNHGKRQYQVVTINHQQNLFNNLS